MSNRSKLKAAEKILKIGIPSNPEKETRNAYADYLMGSYRDANLISYRQFKAEYEKKT